MISSKNNSSSPPSSTSLLRRCSSDPYSSPAPQPNPVAVDDHRKRKAVSLPQSPEGNIAFNPSLRPPLPPAPPQLLSRSNSDLDSADESYSGYASSSDMSRESDDSHVKRLKHNIRELKALSHGLGLLILDNPRLYPPHNVIQDDPSIEDSSDGEFSQFESDSVEKKG